MCAQTENPVPETKPGSLAMLPWQSSRHSPAGSPLRGDVYPPGNRVASTGGRMEASP
jgi:hypothetical protein